MKWLRERPERYDELDLVDHKGRWKDGGGAAGRTVDEDGDEDMVVDGVMKKGSLFDDEDDEVDEDEEEEEEEDAGVGVGVGAGVGAESTHVAPTATPTTTTSAHAAMSGSGTRQTAIRSTPFLKR